MKASLTMLFHAMIAHGYVPATLNRGTILPLLKNGCLSSSVSSKYRAITLSSLLGKVFDYAFLAKFSDSLNSCHWQHGFKAKHSTAECTWLLKECVRYYFDHGSRVYAAFVDFSSAFDTVDIAVLFKKLL